MDNKSAEQLLNKIAETKKANVLKDLKKQEDNAAARTLISKALLTALGGGMAIRGLTGFRNVLQNRDAVESPTTSEFSLPYGYEEEEKQADAWDNPWTMPSILLGGPAAFYGGWKGVDKLLDKQRTAKSEDELEAAKEEYRQALLGSYKQSSDRSTEELLDSCFEKAASFERLGNLGKGVALTYGIGAPLAAYALVNDRMQKASRRKLLEKAIKERARRRAKQQPIELYALPEPVNISENEE
jgi:hypothetical protein